MTLLPLVMCLILFFEGLFVWVHFGARIQAMTCCSLRAVKNTKFERILRNPILNLIEIAQQIQTHPERVDENILKYVEKTIEDAGWRCAARSFKFMDETGAFGKMRSSY